jgi:hypothetical protein
MTCFIVTPSSDFSLPFGFAVFLQIPCNEKCTGFALFFFQEWAQSAAGCKNGVGSVRYPETERATDS